MARQLDHRYKTALLDWLACAVGGVEEPAARAAAALGDGLAARVARAGAAGHALDFDDTYASGLAHLSAPTAPAALLLADELGASVEEALDAYAAGFEAMGALARASHPALYERGLHPTAVCGGVGAGVAAAQLLDLDGEARESAIAIALLRSSGLQAGFGSAGKPLQVGLAAADGVSAALMARAGARVPLDRVVAGWEAATGGVWAEPGAEERAIGQNWIKPWPCCLQTHSAIECALSLRDGAPADPLTVVVHPVSRRAAAIDEPSSGLEAKFSIPWLVAYALEVGEPGVETFASPPAPAAREVAVREDDTLLESEARVEAAGEVMARVEAAIGSPQRPLDAAALGAKVSRLFALQPGLDDGRAGVDAHDPERLVAGALETVRRIFRHHHDMP